MPCRISFITHLELWRKTYDNFIKWIRRLRKNNSNKKHLKLNKEKYRVIEEGLCGRTTVFEDPLRDGRKGTALLPTLLETHAQVDVITLMLGTNDCKTVFGASADVIGKGILRLLDQIQICHTVPANPKEDQNRYRSSV